MIISEINIKLAILGYWGVGKTSIVNKFLEKKIPEMYIPTIGSNIARKEYILPDYSIRVNLWDIGGQRSFNPLNPAFFSNIDAAFLVYDLTNSKETLLELQQTYLSNLIERSPDCTIFLLGNKSDLIKPEESETLLSNIREYQVGDFPNLFVSAKTGTNISEAFELITYYYLRHWEAESGTNKIQGISRNFLDVIDKKAKELEDLVINFNDLDLSSMHKKITPKIITKVVKSNSLNQIKDNALEEYRTFRDLKLEKELIKDRIIEAFNNNLTVVKEMIDKLKFTSINDLLNQVDLTSDELEYMKDDFELKLNTILKLNLDEETGIDESSKLEKDIIGDDHA